jgi:hypothetical protein
MHHATALFLVELAETGTKLRRILTAQVRYVDIPVR